MVRSAEVVALDPDRRNPFEAIERTQHLRSGPEICVAAGRQSPVTKVGIPQLPAFDRSDVVPRAPALHVARDPARPRQERDRADGKRLDALIGVEQVARDVAVRRLQDRRGEAIEILPVVGDNG